MPEKVIGGGFLVPGAAEVSVPSWGEFNAAIAGLRQKIDSVNDNKQAIWDILDQFKEAPPHGTNTDFQREVRKIYEDIRELERNVWRKNPGEDRYTLWECIKALEDHVWHEGPNRTTLWQSVGRAHERLNSLPDALRDAVREAIRAELEPLLDPAAANIGALLEDNRKLREELASLRAEVDKLKTASIS